MTSYFEIYYTNLFVNESDLVKEIADRLETYLMNRRAFIKLIAVSGALLVASRKLFPSKKDLPFQVVDYHVHPCGRFPREQVKARSEELDIPFGIVPHPAPRYGKISTDEDLIDYVEQTHELGLYAGLQPVNPGWHEMFSERARSCLDYVLMDALEIPDGEGGYYITWRDNFELPWETSKFMDRYLDFYENVIANEKIQILASPTFLPRCIRDEYEELWTAERMNRIIKSAVENGVALEINSGYQIPDAKFVERAKRKGAKFSFGTNSWRAHRAGNLTYSIDIAKSCGLKASDIFTLNKGNHDKAESSQSS